MKIARLITSNPLRAVSAILAALAYVVFLPFIALFLALERRAEVLGEGWAAFALGRCYDNTIDPGLKREKILNTFIEAFRIALLPLTAFSTNMTAEPLTEGDEVSVPYIPLAQAAVPFEGTYEMQDTTWQKKKLTVDQHDYVSMALSDKDIFKTPFATLEQQARQKAFQLAKAVLQDVLSPITNANFGAAIFTGAAAGFDLDSVADIRTQCVKDGWPGEGRSMVLAADYYGAVVKVNTFQNVNEAGTASVRETGVLPNLYKFNMFECEAIPDNGENLKGFAVYPSALGVGMRYLQPQPGNTYFEAKPLTDPETGITVGFRDWYDNNTGTRKQVFEALWGKILIEPKACKRIVSA
jgi:hypothetical protein